MLRTRDPHANCFSEDSKVSKVPSDNRISKATLTNIDAVSRTLTRFMSEVSSGFGDLSFIENMRAQWHNFDVLVPPNDDLNRRKIMSGYRASAGSLPASGSVQIVNYDTKEWDTHNAVTTGASWKFTAPFSGKFLVNASITLVGCDDATIVQMDLYKNGVKYRRLFRWEYGDTVGGDCTMIGSVVADCVQGDYLDIRGSQNNASARNYDPDDETWVQITEIDPGLAGERLTDPVPASCWPYNFAYDFSRRPLGVIITEVRELSSNAFVWAGIPDWDMIPRNSKNSIQIRNIPGLTPGRAYRITVLVIVE